MGVASRACRPRPLSFARGSRISYMIPDINIQHQAVLVTVQATSYPAIFVQSLMCHVTLNTSVHFSFLCGYNSSHSKKHLKLIACSSSPPTCCMHLTSYHWLVVIQSAGLQLFCSRVIVQTLSLVAMPKFSLELGSP